MTAAPFIFAGEFRGRQGDRGVQGNPGPAGPGTGVGAMQGAVMLSDGFQRSDRDLNEDTTDTGQQWTMNRPEAIGVHALVDHAYVPDVVPGHGDYLRSPLSSTFAGIVVDYFYTAGDTGAQNMVLGSYGATFVNEVGATVTSSGFGNGSIQLAISPQIQTVEVADGVTEDVHWWLFNPRNPLTDPYPSIMWGTFTDDLPEDGTVLRAGLWYDDATRLVTVQLPDGSTRTASTSGSEGTLMATAAKYWGRGVGIQCRRPTKLVGPGDPGYPMTDDPGTDGYVGFLRVAVHGVDVARAQPVTAAIPYFGGEGAIRYPAPRWTLSDLICVANVSAADWTPGVHGDQQTIVAQWSTDGKHSFDFAYDHESNLRLLISRDGSANDSYVISDSSLAFTDGTAHWVAAYRTAVDGKTRFYYSNDDPSLALASVTWTQLGTSQTGTAGAPKTSTGRVELGTRGSANPLVGAVRFFGVYSKTGGTSGTSIATALSGSTVGQESDFRGAWTGKSTTGDRGTPQGLSFVATQASVDGLVTRLLADEAAIAAGSSGAQPLDSDLTAIAALTPTDNDVIQRKSGAWVNRTPSQLKADMVVVQDAINDGTLAIAPSQNAVYDALASRDAALVTSLAGKQDHDTDLDAIAALAASNDDVIQRKAGAWVNRTIPQLKSDLGLVADAINDGTVAVAPSQNAVFDALALKSDLPTVATKGSDQTLTQSSTTLQTVTGLVVAVAASHTYDVRFYVYYDGDATADLRVHPTVPSGATMEWWVNGGSTALAAAGTGTGNYNYADESTANLAVGAAAVGTKTVAVVTCRVHVGVTAGNVGLEAAQNSVSATNTTIFGRSQVVARKDY